jgi:hypothetical protein
MNTTIAMALIFWGITAAVSGAAAYLGAYLKKKGENLATHEDIAKLVDQVSAVTTTAKEIEAKIEGEAWDRQRRWELKRDVLFEINKSISQMVESLTTFYGIVQTDISTMREPRFDKRGEAYKKFNKAAGRFDQSAFQAQLVCGREVVGHLLKFSMLMRDVAEEIHKENTEALQQTLMEITLKRDVIKESSRNELGFEDERPKGCSPE